MAFSHIHFDAATQYGRILRSALEANESADDRLAAVVSLMAGMIDGDGSLASHFTEVTVRFVFPSDAISKAAYDELNAMYLKTSGNGSVSNVRAARDQAYNKFRG